MTDDAMLDDIFALKFGRKFKRLARPKPTELKREQWCISVNSMLISGLGVEDIGIKMKCPADNIRRHVQFLRSSGTLNKWWR